MNRSFKANLEGLLDKLRNHALPLAILTALVMVTYYNILSHSFLINWDDQAYVTRNPAIRGFSLENLYSAFTRYYVGNYAPIQIISYMLDYAVWGLKPFGFLLANVTYHLVSGILFYFVLVRHGLWKWGALFGCAVFLVHPVQMESVAWVSQRKNLLAMMFYLMAFLTWLLYREKSGKERWKWYVTSLFFFTLSLLSKSVAVILPIMLILHDVLVPPVRRCPSSHADKIPYIVAAGVVGLIAIMTQTPEYGGGRVLYPDDLMTIPLTMLPVLARYLGILLWPAPSKLCIMYFPEFRNELDVVVILSLCLTALLTVFGVYLYRRSKACFFWYALFFLGLVPVSQIVPLVTQMNDRYLYFPMLGVAGLMACLCTGLKKYGWHKMTFGWTGGVVAVVVVVTLSCACAERGRVWQDTIALFSDAVAKAPNQSEPWSRLAEGYVHVGNLKAAEVYYENAASIGTLDSEAIYNLAQIYLDRGELTKAYEFIRKVQSSTADFKDASFFLGEYYYKTGAYKEAEAHLLRHVNVFPNSAPGLFALGHVYATLNNTAKAREFYDRAVRAGGESPELFYSFACLESMEGNIDQSLKYLQKALELGFNKRELLENFHYLDNARRSPRFEQIVNTYLGVKPK